ncbi:MAG TPA: cytochrome P450 [Solirubrobacteraceae bacterium]
MSVGETAVADQTTRAATVVDGLPRRIRLPAIAQTLWSVFGMESFVEFCIKRYPDDGMLAFRITGIGDVVSVLDPKLIGEVFTGDSDVLRGGEANAQAFGAIVGPDSLLLLDGERHLYARRLLLPPFHGEAIAHHEQLIEQIATSELERWPLGDEFALWPRMRAITMKVILRAVIGVRDEQRRRRLAELLPAFAHGGVFGALAEARLPWLTHGAIGRRTPWVKDRAQATRLLLEEIAEHRASPDGREDILAMLTTARDEQGRGLGDSELLDHVLTLLGAGHDTTAAALAWCFERVLRHPDVLERCRAAIAEDDRDYLTAVVNETLRTRPVADSVARKLNAPLELDGYRIPAGTFVIASIRGVQYSPTVWPDPHSFRPERFLERQAPYTFIPFGGGDRRCIGASFATMEIRTVLATILQRIELRPARQRDERATRIRSIAIVPASGTRVIASARAQWPSPRP